MPVTFEESAIAFAQQMIRAENAERKVKELEAEVARLTELVRKPDESKEKEKK